MRTGEVAKILGVDAVTIRRWIERDEFKSFFSEAAKGEHGGVQKLLTEDDVLILNTVRALRTGEKVMDWTEIADKLQSGFRVQEFPQNAISADPRTIPLQQAEQSAKAMATMAERDAALRQVEQLGAELQVARQRIRELEQERDSVKESLLREMMDLRQQIGRLEGLLEALKDEPK